MLVSQSYGSNFLKASDLSSPLVLTIERVTIETLQDGERPKLVIAFIGQSKRLVLNATNANAIAAWYGDDATSWTGHSIQLYPDTTFFSGRHVACIRVRRPQQPPHSPSPQAPVPPPQQPVAPPPPPQPTVQAPPPDLPFDV